MKFSEYMKREMGKQMDAQMEIVRRWENTKDKKENQLTDWAKRLQENEERQEQEKIEIDTARAMIREKRAELEVEEAKLELKRMNREKEYEMMRDHIKEEKMKIERAMDTLRKKEEKIQIDEMNLDREKADQRRALIALGISAAVGWGLHLVKLIAEIIKIYA